MSGCEMSGVKCRGVKCRGGGGGGGKSVTLPSSSNRMIFKGLFTYYLKRLWNSFDELNLFI